MFKIKLTSLQPSIVHIDEKEISIKHNIVFTMIDAMLQRQQHRRRNVTFVVLLQKILTTLT